MHKKEYIKPLADTTILAADEHLLAGSEITIDTETTTQEQFSRTELLFFMVDAD